MSQSSYQIKSGRGILDDVIKYAPTATNAINSGVNLAPTALSIIKNADEYARVLKAMGQKKKRGGVKPPTEWQQLVSAVREKYPQLSFKEALQVAKKLYRQ